MTDDWRNQALCREADPELFFPDSGETEMARHVIRTYCVACPVRLDCLDYALNFEPADKLHAHGIWGGTTVWKRQQLRRERRGAA